MRQVLPLHNYPVSLDDTYIVQHICSRPGEWEGGRGGLSSLPCLDLPLLSLLSIYLSSATREWYGPYLALRSVFVPVDG